MEKWFIYIMNGLICIWQTENKLEISLNTDVFMSNVEIFKDLFPKINWILQFVVAEAPKKKKLNVGFRSYVKIFAVKYELELRISFFIFASDFDFLRISFLLFSYKYTTGTQLGLSRIIMALKTENFFR